jgi:site-specific DNA recombinase
MAFAELERDTIEQRMADGRRRVASDTWEDRNGKRWSYWMGGQCPYGFKVIVVTRRRAIIPNEDPIPGCEISEAEVVRRIYSWATAGRMSLIAIAERLTSMGIPTHSDLAGGAGRRQIGTNQPNWGTSALSLMLKRPIYRGEGRYGQVSQRVPPIVSEEVWHQAQRSLRDRMKYTDRNAKTNYLLRGKVRCAVCGYGFTGRPYYVGKMKKEGAHWYLCTCRLNPKAYHQPRCSAPTLHGHELDALVWDDILRFIENPGEALQLLHDQLTGTEQEEAILTRLLDEEKRRADQKQAALKKLRRAYVDEVITEAEYREDKADYERELAECNARMAELADQIADQNYVTHQLQDAEETLAALQEEVGGEWTWERKRRLVELLVDTVLVGHDGIEINYVFSQRATTTASNPRRRSPACTSASRARSASCSRGSSPGGLSPAPGRKRGTEWLPG